MATIYMTNKGKDDLPERHELDFYKTPYEFANAVLLKIDKTFLTPMRKPVILDPGAGDGVWGKEARKIWPDATIVGVEINPDLPKPDEYDHWITGDYLRLDVSNDEGYDLVVGNPPFKLAEEFIEYSMDYLKSTGYLSFLLRLSFLESIKRYDRYWNTSNLRPEEVWVSTRRVSWYNNKKTNATAYAIFNWAKVRFMETRLDWINWDYERS